MKYKFGDWVITNNGDIGIVVEIYTYDQRYFVKLTNGDGRLYFENELTEWHGAW